MSAPKYRYYTEMLEIIVDYNDRNNAPLSNEKLQQEINRAIIETRKEERNTERNANNVTMDNFCYQYPVTTNTQGEIANVKNEK